MSKHELWLTRDNGNRIALLDSVVRFEYNKIVNGIGRCTILLPEHFDRSLLGIDYKIEIWRSAEANFPLRLENTYRIRRPIVENDLSGMKVYEIHGVDGSELLLTRIVAFAAGSGEADKTDFVDDMMKVIVRENLGAAAGLDPDGFSRSFDAAYFAVDPNFSLGPVITKSFAYRYVLTLLQDLSEVAREAGNQVYFGIFPNNVTGYIFRTFLNQVGQDRRYPGGFNPVIFSLDMGNISTPVLEDDYENEENYIYAAGQGEEAERNIQTAYDLARMTRSIWGRREGFKDSRHEELDAGVVAEAQAKLAEGRPRRRFSCALTSIEGSRYGSDWDFGDRVTVVYDDQQFDGMIWSVSASVDGEGLEKINARFEVEDVA
jgi:hypothetical protein